VNLSTGSSHQLDGSGQHFLRGSPGEGEQEDSLRSDARLDQVSDPVHKSSGLSGSCAGHDQERSVAKSGRRQLLRIQLLGEIPGLGCLDDS
jgi:hypothetical protein